jgi:DNA-nicking Smr family endonuclease
VKRPLRPDELRVWGQVAATVHPLPGRETPNAAAETLEPRTGGAPLRLAPGPAARTRPSLRAGQPPRDGEDKAIEPNRRQRITREREPIGARLDLHGYDQDRARAVLEAFLVRAWEDGWRAVLVITGKGVQGDGVLRKRAPEWLAAPHLSPIVAGISEAHRRHGGEGALYVALKRKAKG